MLWQEKQKKNVSTKNSWWITPNESLLDYVIRICKSIKIVIILAIPGAIYGSIQLWEWYKDYKNRPQRELRIKIDELHTDIDNDIKKLGNYLNQRTFAKKKILRVNWRL